MCSNFYATCRFPVSATLVDNQQDSDRNVVSVPYNYWVGKTGVSLFIVLWYN